MISFVAAAPHSDPDPGSPRHDESPVPLIGVAVGLSFALDLAEGQPTGHAARSALIGMRLAAELGLDQVERRDLLYGLLLKDLGCTSTAARLVELFDSDDHLLKRAHRLVDWTIPGDATRYAFKHAMPGGSRMARAWHALRLGRRSRTIFHELAQLRATQGVEIATRIGLPDGAVATIAGLDEHWSGRGGPDGLAGSAVPMLARIGALAQAVDVFARAFDVQSAFQMARERSGTWFDPTVVDALAAVEYDATFWQQLSGVPSSEQLAAAEPDSCRLLADEQQLDRVAEGFARVVDGKSRFTREHSTGVAFLAGGTAEALDLSQNEVRSLRRAALLHDIGMLGVSSRILDHPGSLDPVEVQLMRQHTRYTFEILKQVSTFRRFAATAAAHHERIDGSGYHVGLHGEELGVGSRILAVADCAEAMLAERPYRPGLGYEETVALLRQLSLRGQLCPLVVEAFTGWFRQHAGDLPAAVAAAGVAA